MKLKLFTLLAITGALIAATPLPVRAQSATITPGSSNSPAPLSTNAIVKLINQGLGWISTPDTNNTTLETTKFRMETGPAVQSGVTVSDNVFLQYNVAYSNRLALCSETRNASIAGTIVAEEVGPGYNIYQKWDTEITAFALAGWRFDQNHDVFSIGATVRHMLNSAMYIAPSVQLDFAKKAGPMIIAYAGWAF